MKLVCLVPSLTETLLWAGVELVGRTAFCIHPKESVGKIPVVGGTKKVDWEKLSEKPDLVIFDKEENLKEMADDCPFDWCATHVSDLKSLKEELDSLAKKLSNDKLSELSNLCEKIINTEVKLKRDLSDFPGVIQRNVSFGKQSKACYLIWKKPYMTVSKSTFIFSVLEKLGYGSFFNDYKDNYPSLEELPSEDVALLLSSEPYPFEKDWKEYESSSHPAVIVDGELFSWFGLRSIRFLEKHLEL